MENEQDQNQPTQQGIDDLSQTTQSVGKTALKGAGKLADVATSKIRKQVASKLKMLAKKGLSKVALAAAPLLAKAALVAVAAGAILASFLVFLFSLLLSILTWSVAFVMLVLVILFIINSGAYVVPPGQDLTIYGSPSEIPEGGTLSSCANYPDIDITSSLAARISGGSVRLLPDDNGARLYGTCFIPQMIILHSSAGYDNNQGNDRTYETLVNRDVACQLATDTDDTILMQPFYESVVEVAWCANSWNDRGISIELAGECADGKNPCRRNYSECQVGDDSYPYTFEAPGSTATHPCPNLSDLAYNALCEVMQQYNIPWCQVYTHDDVPDATHKDVVGKGWVNNYFIPRLRDNCNVPANSQCRNT